MPLRWPKNSMARVPHHLNRQNLDNLRLGLQFRPALAAQLANVVAQGQLSPRWGRACCV